MSFFFRRTQDAAEAEDLTQEVFLRLLRVQPDVAQLEQPDHYVFTVAANLCRDRGRSAVGRARDRSSPLEDVAAKTPPELVEDRAPERVLLGREAVQVVANALLELPAKTREIFVLFRFEAMPQRQIAQRYGISVSAVEKHIARALAHALERLGRP